LKLSTTTPTRTDSTFEAFRSKVAEAHTRVVESNVFDWVTGEYYGEYITTPYTPEPTLYTKGTPARLGENWFIEDDGTASPLAPIENRPQSTDLAPVIELFPQKPSVEVRSSPIRGPKPQVISNLIAPALCILKFEQRPTPWLDDIAFGAIYTGPGLINGKHSVSLADVKKVLRLSVISTATAATCLLNHERQPMSTRQLQRVVEAARTALRGVVLHLERHPQILQSIDMQVDFNRLWRRQEVHPESSSSNEHSMKQQALELIRSNTPTKAIARELGISKNTVKVWRKEANTDPEEGGVNSS
jgi:hypothetical protein